MQPAWNHCAPYAHNSLQIGGMDLQIVFSGLGKNGAWGGACGAGGGRSFLVRTRRGLASATAFRGSNPENRELSHTFSDLTVSVGVLPSVTFESLREYIAFPNDVRR